MSPLTAKAAAKKKIDEILDKVNWGDYLENGLKVPKRHPDDHAHHIFPKKGCPGQKELVEEGQQILREVGINPHFGKENLTWAKKKGNHTDAVVKDLVDALRKVRGNRDEIERILREAGQAAQDRG